MYAILPLLHSAVVSYLFVLMFQGNKHRRMGGGGAAASAEDDGPLAMIRANMAERSSSFGNMIAGLEARYGGDQDQGAAKKKKKSKKGKGKSKAST